MNWSSVGVEVSPDPSSVEREAIIAALGGLTGPRRSGETLSAWWEAGIRENAGLDEPAESPA
jgi:hypothetical protein